MHRLAFCAVLFATALGPVVSSAAAGAAYLPGYEVTPEYPTEALYLGIQGDVRLQCVLGNQGEFLNCSIRNEAPEGYGFGKAALDAARRARIDIAASGFESKIGKSLGVPIAFRLEDPPSDWSEPAGSDIFAEGADLSPEDRAAQQVSPAAPPGSACPDGRDCGVAY